MSRGTVLLVIALAVLAGCGAGPQETTTPDDPATTEPETPPTDATVATPTATDASAADGAGTDAPTTSPPTTTDPPEDGPVYTAGFDPEYDAVAVLQRVQAIRGVNASQQLTVTTDGLPRFVRENRSVEPSQRFFGLTSVGVKALQYASTEERVPVASPGRSREGYTIELLAAEPLRERYNLSQEVILAHEIVHVLQREAGVYDVSIDPSTTDGSFTLTAVVEGDAASVEEAYRERYTDQSAEAGRYFSVAARNRTPNRSRWLLGLANVAYYEGYRYYQQVADEPTEHDAILRNPPNTTAGLLHPDSSATFPGEPLPAPSVEGYEIDARDRIGELATRYALRLNDVPYGEASAAATGWRNDTLVTYSDVGPETVYWGSRWANASEASEFATAWRGMLRDRDATESDGVLTVPGTQHTPEMHYVVEVDGSVVHIAAAEERADAEAVAAEFQTNTTADGSVQLSPR